MSSSEVREEKARVQLRERKRLEQYVHMLVVHVDMAAHFACRERLIELQRAKVGAYDYNNNINFIAVIIGALN